MKRVIRLIFDSFIVISLISCTDNKPSTISSIDEPSSSSYSSIEESSTTSKIEESNSSISIEDSSDSSSISPSSESIIIEKSYTITWINYDNEILKIDTDIKEGVTPSYDGETPTRSNDDTYSYTFTGWTPTIEVVSKDITYTATYKAEPLPICYHVEFVNYNGSLLYEVDVLEGEEAIYVGDAPKRPSDDDYTYEFIGWDKDLLSIEADTVATATYKANKIDWGTIIWF